MKAKFKTPVIHDIKSTNISQNEVDFLIELFESKMKDAESIGVKKATFLISDVAIAVMKKITNFELNMDVVIIDGVKLWNGVFSYDNQVLEILGGLE